MRKIRKNVFETNSSSVHSIVFSTEGIEPCNIPLDADGKMHIPYGEFGKEEASYTDQLTKLSYLVSLCWYCADYDIEDEINFIKLEEYIMDYVPGCTGIVPQGDTPDIDHQSAPWGSIEIIDMWDKEAVLNYIFNPKVELRTGSD